MDRTPLPNRRPNQTLKLNFNGQEIFVTLGYDPDTGEVKEVFGSAKNVTSDIDYLIADCCVAISIALQRGAALDQLLRSMSFRPVVGDADKISEPASLIGFVLQQALKQVQEDARG